VRVVATTVVRESVFGRQETGYVYDIDLDAGAVEHRLPVPPPSRPAPDDNPRGGIRGGRGVAVTPMGVVLATYDTLVRYDDGWQIADVVESPLFAGLHEISWDGEALWVTATAIDALLRVDGRVPSVAWDPHGDTIASILGVPDRDPALLDRCDREGRPAPRLDHCHLNGVTRRGDAVILHLGLVRRRRTVRDRLARRVGALPAGESLVVRLNGTPQPEILVRLRAGELPTHNGQFVATGRIAVNDSTANTLRIFAAETGAELHAFPMPGTWLRGLAPLGDGRALVGTAPAAIRAVDLASGVIERTVTLSDNPNEAVHGLTVVR
jgi:hypothetical protein